MHELSIAMSLIEMATEEAESRGVRVCAIHLRLGRLSGVVREALESSYEIAREGTAMDATQLNIEDVPVQVDCPTCGRRDVVSIQDLRCVQCGAPATRIVSGRELEVFALEVEEPAVVPPETW